MKNTTTRSISIDAYVIDTLMRDLIGHDRAPSAFIVYLHLYRQSVAVDGESVRMSLRDIADGTGLSKRGVQEAVSILSRRKLVRIAREGITEIPEYTVQRPWYK